MGPSAAKRRVIFYVILIGCGLAVCGWQAEEHVRFRHSEEQRLINRGRDITSTLGVLLRSQSRFGRVPKDRLELTLQDLVRPEELESVAILGSSGATIVTAGKKLDLTAEMLQSRGVFWRRDTVTIMNLLAELDLGTGDDGGRRPTIVVPDERTARAFGPPRNRRSNDGRPDPNAPAPDASSGNSQATSGQPPGPRFTFGRPTWMSPEEYDELIQKQGVHSLVISLSTVDLQRKINADLLLRSLVSLLAMGGAIVSSLAWRNVGKNAELQIRLVKAGEMNTHLKEMNLAAAGLAHETRNPLNLIRGFAQMISMQVKDSPKLQEHASAIIEEADRVTVQLNEFINYSKPREAQLGPVEVSRLVADVARTLRPDLEEKHIELRQPDSTLRVEADEQLFRQALFNVLLNAVQAVDAGGHIEVRLTAASSREAMLEIADDGPGVPASDRASIFKPYVTMRPDGVGLGLAIVAQIAAVHHWEVACDANEPRGAVFRFRHLKVAASTA
jgi:signal transduction histidine kinase